MDRDVKQLREKLAHYEHQQEKWNQQREFYVKNINLMQQQINRYKAINSNLLKKAKHKRTSSEEQTFIFNQTNISSYYPIMMMKNNNWVTKATLRSHLDSVRAISWQGKYLISAGEDSLLKIWERDKLLITVREHLAAIYSICGNQNLLFTGGAEGVIRKWATENFLHNQGPQAEAEFHEDCIWQLIWNKKHQILVSSSADSTCKVMKASGKQITEVSTIKIQGDIPTSIEWINDSSFVTGLVKNNRLWVYDIQTNKRLMEFGFQGRQNISQVNKIVQQPKQKLLAVGHQDRVIRFFDPNSNKPIKSLVAHSDAVSSLCFRPIDTNELISCSHDGTLRIWDIRQYRCTHDVALHMRKYDESVMCLAHSQEEPGIAVGGADGLLKLLYPEN